MKPKKRPRSPSPSSSSSSSSSGSSDSSPESRSKKRKKEETKQREREKKRIKKEKKRAKKLRKKEKKMLKKLKKASKLEREREDSVPAGPAVPSHILEASKAKAPMTKEEWEKQQSTVRRVYDPDTGRHRLIKGRGEVLEECVSRERHIAINKAATKGDGQFFQSSLMEKINKR